MPACVCMCVHACMRACVCVCVHGCMNIEQHVHVCMYILTIPPPSIDAGLAAPTPDIEKLPTPMVFMLHQRANQNVRFQMTATELIHLYSLHNYHYQVDISTSSY